ncbi:hypothetical protein KH5H1_45510 [Corallococcus caeni]|nr:hypothetical protein KH5H1_45510 [Corallococcus sp. KH5-1]
MDEKLRAPQGFPAGGGPRKPVRQSDRAGPREPVRLSDRFGHRELVRLSDRFGPYRAEGDGLEVRNPGALAARPCSASELMKNLPRCSAAELKVLETLTAFRRALFWKGTGSVESRLPRWHRRLRVCGDEPGRARRWRLGPGDVLEPRWYDLVVLPPAFHRAPG